MKKIFLLLLTLNILNSVFPQIQKDYPIKSIAFTKVKISDNFWTKRMIVNRDSTLPLCFKKCEETGRIDNFAIAGKLKKGKFSSAFPFDDSDVFKVIEGACFSLSSYPDRKLDKYLDSLIYLIGKAQEPDGYLYTNRTIDPQNTHRMAGKERWINERRGSSHELYNAGLLYEAAVAHYQATGKKTLLDIAIKNANLIENTFGPDKKHVAPGHQVIEMGLVKLYRVTGDIKYLNLAKYFIDERGHNPQNADSPKSWENGSYFQDKTPVVYLSEAEGHAVRAAYLYAGMADVAALTGDTSYINAIDRIWNNVVLKKLYITGGIGAIPDDESFGKNYELPNLTAYNETCAALANVLWNHRMFLLHGDSKYIDVLERSLYNGLISGISLQGTSFFYPNPLESDAKYKFNHGSCSRQAWFNCSCCPTNVVRLIPSLPGYIYAFKDNSVYINLFINSSSELTINNNKVTFSQESNYPWEGNIKININPVKKTKFSLHIRIPCWAINKPVPSDLYSYSDTNEEKVNIKINGKAIEYKVIKGYAVLSGEWKKGDYIELQLPLNIRRVKANPEIKADINKVALERGPIVYCLEAVDNYGKISNIILPDNVKLSASFKPALLNGITVITGEAPVLKVLNDGINIKTEKQTITAIPYYVWAHRGISEMK
ncbi:MAG: glycoside hydrolase family 127 protein, partial [Bacteroidales bacterium]|nr:glycoside hydrolase family 127 protein [Bacteroidales bacterium]